jgi:hypothetical protein
MAYHKKPYETEIQWYATEIIKAHGENNRVWLLQEPTDGGIIREYIKRYQNGILVMKKICN